jgi:hypothetical protein
MGREFSLGLGRVLEQIMLASVGPRHKTQARSEAQGDSADRALPTGQRRILEHVAMMSVEKRLKMPR